MDCGGDIISDIYHRHFSLQKGLIKIQLFGSFYFEVTLISLKTIISFIL